MAILNWHFSSTNNVGNIIRLLDVSAGIDGEIQRFEYDALDRLEHVRAENSPRTYAESYTYDAVGNLVTKGGASYTYSTDQPHAVTQVGADTYSYDANGNMTTRTEDGRTYKQTWNAHNKLARVTWTADGAPCNAEFVYDGDGNRLLKIDHMLNQFDPDTPAEVVTVYVGAIYERQVNTSENPLGTPVAGKTPDGVDPIMACLNLGDSPTDFGFTGQRSDSDFGLSDYNARFYSPRLGRFISPDSIVSDPTNSLDHNRYMYGYDNRVNFSDPSGHCATLENGAPNLETDSGCWVAADEWLKTFGVVGYDNAEQWFTYFTANSSTTEDMLRNGLHAHWAPIYRKMIHHARYNPPPAMHEGPPPPPESEQFKE